MAPKTVLALLLVFCLAELACASPALFHSRRSTNEVADDSTNDTGAQASSSDATDDSNTDGDNVSSEIASSETGISGSEVLSEIEDKVDGFFGRLFGKRDTEFPTDVFTTLYQEWAKGRPNRSITVRDWLQGDAIKRSVTV